MDGMGARWARRACPARCGARLALGRGRGSWVLPRLPGPRRARPWQGRCLGSSPGARRRSAALPRPPGRASPAGAPHAPAPAVRVRSPPTSAGHPPDDPEGVRKQLVAQVGARPRCCCGSPLLARGPSPRNLAASTAGEAGGGGGWGVPGWVPAAPAWPPSHARMAARTPRIASCTPQVRKAIGPIATPDVIQWAPALPKTRSGACCAVHAVLCCTTCCAVLR